MIAGGMTANVRAGTWEADSRDIRCVRNTVFTEEQGIDESLDFDGHDAQCVHVLARSPDGAAIGTARMLPDGHVGRIAVLAPWRGRGIGTRLVEHLVAAAADAGISEVHLHAQVHAAGFYERLGFEAHGEPFLEAGIEHVRMARRIP